MASAAKMIAPMKYMDLPLIVSDATALRGGLVTRSYLSAGIRWVWTSVLVCWRA
jgi:hypothetical protein